MKKLLAIGLTAIMTLSLCSCGGGDQTEGAASNENDKETQKFLDSITSETAEAKGVCGADLTWYYQDGVLVIKGTGDMNDYVDGWGDSTAPWNDSDAYNETVHWIILDEGVTSVGKYAFYHMENLAKVDFSDSIVEIREGAFEGCSQLTSIKLPQKLEMIERDAFNCENLSGTLILPAGLTEYSSAFSECNFTKVELADGIAVVEFGAMDSEEVVIPASVREVQSLGYSTKTVTFLGSAPEIDLRDMKDINGQVIGYQIPWIYSGFMFDRENNCYTTEEKGESVTINYSGEGFEKYIELCPQYNWVKK